MTNEQQLHLEDLKANNAAAKELEELHPHEETQEYITSLMTILAEKNKKHLETHREKYRKAKTFKEKNDQYETLKNREIGYTVVMRYLKTDPIALPYEAWVTPHHLQMIKKYGYERMLEYYTALQETYV